MTYETRFEKAQHSHQGRLATSRAGFPPLESMRGTVTAGRQATAGCSGLAWPKCHQKRGYKPRPKGNGRSRMVKPIQPWRSRSGAIAIRPTSPNPARLKNGLQSVRLHAVPAGLRLGKAGCETGLLPNHGLHATGHAGKTSDGCESSRVAKGQKNENGSPATGQSSPSSSRHGTEQPKQWAINSYFVPPRDKTPCFSESLRPATGHLYRLAICREVFSEGGKA